MACVDVTVEEISRLKRESEQLKSENMRFRNIIDNAGLCVICVKTPLGS